MMSRKIQLNVSELEQSGSAKVINEFDDTKYLIIGRWGLVSDSYSVYSRIGELLVEIKQRTLGTHPQFELFASEDMIGTSLFNVAFRYTTLYINGINWLVVGNEKKQNYIIFNGHKRIGAINSFNNDGKVVRIITATNLEYEPIIVAISAILNHPVVVNHLNISKNPFKNFSPSLD
ncbi:hypothetical protein [Lentilactobacillus sp. Marseille-Q4993]|uniref:hypothetical protein n=1 Tax=Lentilactobacillus sp. Marseille-Q4993 TaxID=3039492 RepID=UPI0024BC27F1|nr:hypothetical protein [Lentilactobacillus sp. Marseille-Q4993]